MSQTAIQEIRPWERPFWRPARGKAGVLFYLVLIHTLAVIGLILFPLPSLRILSLTLLFTALGGFGTTVCYHRMLAHRTLKLNKVIEHLLVFWAMFNGSGAPASWVAYHRHHHSRSDTPEDICSPTHGGFWWAHLRWLYQSAPADPQRWCPELNHRAYKFWTLAQAPVVLLSLFCGLALGWQGFFWLGAIRLVYSLHMQCLVNSLTHLGHSEEGDSSKNVWWLGPLQLTAWGENWHRNHHSNAGSARLGLRWWQMDIGWYFIYALEMAGLARNVKRPRAL
ncbi:MAG TPA: fatty acid desaturase [Candidatus Acidoferrales bacterium]|jgi:stearoyl-CoA desaturase (delta-9 desaturase)|nr:fatty acid desaturase [Candidatus Acidoferrales bacterium]